MVIEPMPKSKGDVMYGITFDLDTHILEDELKVSRQKAYQQIETLLESVGYTHIQYSVYVCNEPKTSEITVIHETIETLKQISWFNSAVTRILAFEIKSWGDLLPYFQG